MTYFVFLEFGDQRIASFLNELKAALSSNPLSTTMHITLRGPYVEQPDPDQVRVLSNKLRGYGVRVFGAGKFETDKGYAVFLRAESVVFPEIWWKPDYSAGQQPIQPHITVFETSRNSDADSVLRFLKGARICIYTHNVELTVHTSKQSELFGSATVAHRDGRKPIRRDQMTMGPEVLIRAHALGAKISSQQADA